MKLKESIENYKNGNNLFDKYIYFQLFTVKVVLIFLNDNRAQYNVINRTFDFNHLKH